MLKKQKIYRDKHKEQIKERREQSKVQLNAYKREKIVCQHCQSIIGRSSMSKHIQRKHTAQTINYIIITSIMISY